MIRSRCARCKNTGENNEEHKVKVKQTMGLNSKSSEGNRVTTANAAESRRKHEKRQETQGGVVAREQSENRKNH